MTGLSLLQWAAIGWILVAAATWVVLWFIPAPYGRYSRPGWGPALPAWLGWMVMEAASPLALGLSFLLGHARPQPVPMLLAGLWLLHYLNRAFLYPLRMRGRTRPMALSVAALAVLFNAVNGMLNGSHLRLHAGLYPPGWLLDPRFLLGILLFGVGMGINLQSDAILRRLRAGGPGSGTPGSPPGGYRIPRGGLFERVSSANYFGEIVEWCGWACLSWSLAGLSFAVWTAANLIPRARAHHRWYREHFPQYPRERKAVIPFLF